MADASGNPMVVSAGRARDLPVVTATDLGRELKWWMRHGPQGQTKVAALAHRVGVSTSTLYAYLAGATVPPANALDDLMIALRVPRTELRRLATARDEIASGRRPESPTAPAVVPRELPPAPTGFVGRSAEVATLDAALGAARRGTGPGVAVLSGAAGIGKTGLALHWAHLRHDDFPDGQLYVDLRGFSAGDPRETGAVAAALLRSLGQPADLVPGEVDERTARLRSVLASRRVLLVLDNALDAEQVRGLLPAGDAAYCVVTSRHQLDAVLVHPGATRLVLSPLAHTDAGELLGVPTSSDPARRALVDRCGGLPLALRIVAARLAGDGEADRVLADLDSRRGLDDLDLGDAETSVRTVFSWSESRLTEQQARALVLLGVSPLTRLDPVTAAALWELDERDSRRVLDALGRVHLLQARGPSTYGLHDLVAEYVRERATEQLTDTERADGLGRIVAGIVAEIGSTQLLQTEETHARVAARWDDVMVLVDHCATQRRWADVVALVDAMRPQVDIAGRYHDTHRALETALAAARALEDPSAEVRTLRQLGVNHMRLGAHDDAAARLRDGLALAGGLGDDMGRAAMLNDLGNLHARLGACAEAEEAYAEALVLARDAGFVPGEATLLTNLGCIAERLGDIATASAHCERALELFTQVDDAPGIARTLGNLGDIDRQAGRLDLAETRLHEGLGRARSIEAGGIEIEVLTSLAELSLQLGALDEAVGYVTEARRLASSASDTYEEARALRVLGSALAAQGDGPAARDAWVTALSLFERLRLPEAVEVGLLLDEHGVA